MPRLFIAIDLPDEIKESIADICCGVRSARWVPEDQVHLTLRFLGEIDNATYRSVDAALDSVQAEPFSLEFRGVGHFPPRGVPRVLWVGVRDSGGVSALRQKVDSALGAEAIEPERRKFHPHITVARLREGARPEDVVPFLSCNSLFAAGPVRITEFHLYSSVLRPEGAIHNLEETYPLLTGDSPEP